MQEADRVFATAVRRTADEIGESPDQFETTLFPAGPPRSKNEQENTLALYKIMVTSSEELVGRRQGVNTFFLTMNGALLTASGIIVQVSGGSRLAALGILVLAVAGGILCAAWRSLIVSFGQLNRGKFKVINTIERYLPAAIYAAEWEALGQGEDPNIYRSFTSREIWVPNSLFAIHALTALVSISVALGWISLNGIIPPT